jgi:D-alanine-D-alanine ligase
MAEEAKIRLGILFGGRSGEHEVSLVSAASVIRALDPAEFQITVMGVSKTGKLASAAETREMLPAEIRQRVSAFSALDGPQSRLRLGTGGDLVPAEQPAEAAPEIIFPLMHGPYGEDGTVQGLLEVAGIPYIGCGVLASAVGMDKIVMKRLFLQAGLPTLPFHGMLSRETTGDLRPLRESLEAQFGYPMFSKPANLGSSVGVCKIHSAAEFDDALRFAAQFDRKIIVERGVDARELECAVLGNDDPEASTVGEIHPAHEFYDYDAKYHDPGSRLDIPARIPESQIEEIRNHAVAAFRAIDGSGLARVDFFIDRSTGRVWLNEINTMPGFTPISMYTKLWAASGVPFDRLVRRLVELGLERHREAASRRVS